MILSSSHGSGQFVAHSRFNLHNPMCNTRMSLQNVGSQLRNRFFLLLGCGLFGLFGSRRAVIGGSNLAGAGALAVLVLSFMAGHGWSNEEKV